MKQNLSELLYKIQPAKTESHQSVRSSESSYWYIVRKYSSKFLKWLAKDDNWKWVIVTVTLTGIFHILTVLSVPYSVPKSGWARLNDLPINQMAQLKTFSKDGEKTLPRLAPDFRYAACRYNVSTGPLALEADVPNNLFSIAAYDRLGQNFYVLFGSALQRAKLNVILVNTKDLSEMQAIVTESADDVVLVEVPENEGIIILRAPILSSAYENRVETLLTSARCYTK